MRFVGDSLRGRKVHTEELNKMLVNEADRESPGSVQANPSRITPAKLLFERMYQVYFCRPGRFQFLRSF